MRYKISTIVSASSKAIMSKTSCPHYFRTCLIILGIMMQYLGIFHYGTQKSLGYFIREFHVAAVCKITLHRVHHDVGASRFRLIIWQTHCQFWIHDGKFGPGNVVIVCTLFACFLICNNTAVACLTARSRNRQNRRNRKNLFCFTFTMKQLPYIVFWFCKSIGNCLCRIDYRPTADREDKIYLFTFSKFNALSDL